MNVVSEVLNVQVVVVVLMVSAEFVVSEVFCEVGGAVRELLDVEIITFGVVISVTVVGIDVGVLVVAVLEPGRE